uniref:Uncharacterized protein n=1 Tax=Sinocyclocheilus rhinocerous TaxID=307959 RepID=A0A673MHY7_9TELE
FKLMFTWCLSAVLELLQSICSIASKFSVIVKKYIAVGLPIGVIIACGLALLLLTAFVSWKLCWVPWRSKALSSSSAALAPDDCSSFHLPSLLPTVKISHTSPDIPAEVQLSMREHFLRRTQRMQRQATEPADHSNMQIWFSQHNLMYLC